MIKRAISILILLSVVLITADPVSAQDREADRERERIRELGITPGILPTGTHNAITDVSGVLVGHSTLIEGEDIRTGRHSHFAARRQCLSRTGTRSGICWQWFRKGTWLYPGAGTGRIGNPGRTDQHAQHLSGSHGLADYMLNLPDNENVRSVNPVVGETNDGWLNNIRARVITTEHVAEALDSAESGAVAEGNVGAGTGTRALGFKGGIGTSSRIIPEEDGGLYRWGSGAIQFWRDSDGGWRARRLKSLGIIIWQVIGSLRVIR